MSSATLLKHIYNLYDSGYRRRNVLFVLHRKLIQSPLLTKLIFGIEVDRAFVKNGYFDLTTILLMRYLRPRLQATDNPKLLEIGVGRFAVLSAWLSRQVKNRIVACDFDNIAVESAKVHVHRNNLNVDVYQSDILGSVTPDQFDLIFWNLPYYDDPDPLLSRLFDAVPDYLSDQGTMVLGFNGKPLPVSNVLEILSRCPSLEVESVKSYWWNLHVLVAIRKATS